MLLVVPSTYPSSTTERPVRVVILPLESETRAELAVRLEVVIVVAAPVMSACFSESSSFMAAWRLVAAMLPHATLVI